MRKAMAIIVARVTDGLPSTRRAKKSRRTMSKEKDARSGIRINRKKEKRRKEMMAMWAPDMANR
jgi:hypothetical protein